MDIKKEYERWLANATADADVVAELKTLDDAKIEDAFYRDLAFGTGGLRGVIGAGTNRMNIYTVAKASQGLADYLKKNFETPSVAIGYDSRIKSDVFAKVAAGVFAANGVKVNIWPVLMPVPTVSFEMHVIFPVWLTDVVFIGKCPGCFYFFQQSFAMMSVCISTSAVFHCQLPGSFIQNCAYCKAVRIGKADAAYSGAFLHSFLCCPGIGVFLLDRYMEHEPFFLMDQCR